MITAELDKAQLSGIKRSLGFAARNLPKVVASAVNETVKTTNSQISKVTDLALPLKDIRPPRDGGTNPVSKWRFTMATQARPQATITFPYKPISLVHFRYRDTKKRGVRVRVLKSKGQEVRLHAFEAKGRGGAKQVWERWDKRKRIASKRLPIFKVVGPSIKGVAENNVQVAGIINAIPALLQRRLSQQIDRYLKKQF